VNRDVLSHERQVFVIHVMGLENAEIAELFAIFIAHDLEVKVVIAAQKFFELGVQFAKVGLGFFFGNL